MEQGSVDLQKLRDMGQVGQAEHLPSLRAALVDTPRTRDPVRTDGRDRGRPVGAQWRKSRDEGGGRRPDPGSVVGAETGVVETLLAAACKHCSLSPGRRGAGGGGQAPSGGRGRKTGPGQSHETTPARIANAGKRTVGHANVEADLAARPGPVATWAPLLARRPAVFFLLGGTTPASGARGRGLISQRHPGGQWRAWVRV